MTPPYRISSLAFAFVRMWRGWRVLIPVIVLNAVIQALLIWPAFTYGSGVWVLASAVISAIALAASFALAAASALRVADGPVRWADITTGLHLNALRYLIWALIWGVAVAIGFALYVLPGVIVIAATPFLALAVLDGQARPLRANFSVLRACLGRWLITILLVVVVGVVCWNVSGFAAFFLRGPFATLLVWLVGGWLIAWFTTAFALIYRLAVTHRLALTYRHTTPGSTAISRRM